jgi:hypothetical protein
MASG